jgi:hypothetical protein
VGAAIMYEAVYDEHGILAGARKYTDRNLILRCHGVLAELYAMGEPLADFFSRRVAPLQPPPVEQHPV